MNITIEIKVTSKIKSVSIIGGTKLPKEFNAPIPIVIPNLGKSGPNPPFLGEHIALNSICHHIESVIKTQLSSFEGINIQSSYKLQPNKLSLLDAHSGLIEINVSNAKKQEAVFSIVESCSISTLVELFDGMAEIAVRDVELDGNFQSTIYLTHGNLEADMSEQFPKMLPVFLRSSSTLHDPTLRLSSDHSHMEPSLWLKADGAELIEILKAAPLVEQATPGGRVDLLSAFLAFAFESASGTSQDALEVEHLHQDKRLMYGVTMPEVESLDEVVDVLVSQWPSIFSPEPSLTP